MSMNKKSPYRGFSFWKLLVRWRGLEPPRLSAHGPQPCLSASSSTSAQRSTAYYNRVQYIVKQGEFMTRIVVDAMGSDHYPTPDVEGALMAAREYGVEIILVGDEATVQPVLAKQNIQGLKIRLV